VSETCRKTLGFLEKMTLAPESLTAADVPAEVPNGMLREAAEIAAAFNIMVRLADALSFRLPGPASYEKSARMLLKRGYL
jgi:hypothetical protein